MFTNFEVRPNNGFGDVEFGIDMDTFVEKYGEPEEVDDIDEDEEDFNTTILHYWKNGFSVFFVGLTNPVLAGVETDNFKTVLFGTEILDKSKTFIIDLMAKHGINDYEEGADEIVDEDKDFRISFEESMMDFFFRDDKLVYMNFGVFVDENGNIEKV